MKRILFLIIFTLISSNVLSQSIPVEGIISADRQLIIRELVHRTSTIMPEWNRSTLVDTLRLSGSADSDTSISYGVWEQISLQFSGSQAHDSVDVKVYLYCGHCTDDTADVVLIDSLDTTTDIDYLKSWSDGENTFIWHHNAPLSEHFFYIFKGIAATGTEVKYYNGYILRAKGEIE